MRRIALLLTAAIGTVALLAFLYPSMMVNAADVAGPVEGENFTTRPAGTTVVTDTTRYSNDQALKFTQNVTTSHTLVQGCSAVCDVQVLARGGQSGGSPTLSVNGSTPPKAITNNGDPVAYLFDVNLPAGSKTISITAGNTGTGRNPFVDRVSFPASDGGGTDTTPPNVTISSGPGDTSDGAATFTFSGTDNVTPAANLTFQCKLFRGSTTVSNWAACTSPKTYSGLADGDHTFRVRGTDSSNNVSAIRSRTFTVTNGGGGGDADGDGVPDSDDQCPNDFGPPSNNGCPITSGSTSIVGAGDISSGGNRDQETGNVVRTQLNSGAWGVFTTGDNAYPDGTYQNYQVYDAAWGSFRNKTRPTYGNHDYYGSSTAVGSQQYWNEGPDPTPVQVSNANSYYAYDVGNSNWKAIVLNSADTEGPNSNQAPSCATGPPPSPQIEFLNRELNTTKNTVLFWHHSRFSSSTDHPTSEGVTGCSKTFFDVAHDNGADLVVQGHSHLYERYHTRDKSGAKVASGLTSIVCGTGGNSFDSSQGSPSPVPDVKFTNAWGVCKLTLNANNAQVTFLPAANSPGADSATVAVRP
jgi:Calcineurin-like phosphoesterase